MTTYEWISVAERLPDMDVPVFALYPKGRIDFRVRGCDSDSDGWYWCNPYGTVHQTGAGKWESEAELDDDYAGVTHWMPLPEAPAERSPEGPDLEPGAPERDAKKGAGSTPDETLLDQQIAAGWKYVSDSYEDDDRECIRSDVFNAFQKGIGWERRRALTAAPDELETKA